MFGYSLVRLSLFIARQSLPVRRQVYSLMSLSPRWLNNHGACNKHVK